MIILRLEGGLGNSMFEYALGRHLSLKNSSPLKYEISSYKTNPIADCSFWLEKFNIDIKNNLATRMDVQRFERYAPRTRGHYRHIYNTFFANEKRYVRERKVDFDPRVLAVSGDVMLHGWWQDERYFKDIRSTLLTDFAFRSPPAGKNADMVKKIKQSGAAIAVHVRRCDFEKNPKTRAFHGLLGVEYYDEAIAYIAARVPNPELYVFSDDSDWVKKNMKFPFRTTYITWNKNDETGSEDMRLMTYCKHHVIANSSFSWWGAWLAQSPTQIVVAPDRWTNHPGDSSSRVPERWHRIKGWVRAG